MNNMYNTYKGHILGKNEAKYKYCICNHSTTKYNKQHWGQVTAVLKIQSYLHFKMPYQQVQS